MFIILAIQVVDKGAGCVKMFAELNLKAVKSKKKKKTGVKHTAFSTILLT
jgi:hypothetical protein